jgi:TPR repeat protein
MTPVSTSLILVLMTVALNSPTFTSTARADFSAGLRAYGQGDFAKARTQWEGADEANDKNKAMAHYRLGLMLVHGTGVAKDPDTGLAWLRRAADDGLTLAQLDLAELLFQGGDLKRNYAEAFEWSERAAKGGNSLARYYMGRHYDRGLGVSLDYHKAVKHFQFAADKGLPLAQRRLGQYLLAGIAVDRDVEKGLEWLEKARKFYLQAANGGNAKAQYDLAMFYIQGRAGEVNIKEGRFWLQRAAASGIAHSQFRLGRLELTELSHPLLIFEAFDWIGKAWRQSFAGSQEMIAKLAKDLPDKIQFNNLRGKIDPDATIFCMLAYAVEAWADIDEHCARLADFGQVVPQYVMGRAHEHGLGRPKDLSKAHHWYRKAAIAGLPRAQNALGRMVMRGMGVKASPARGANWVRRAAEQGYPPAQFNLGFMHEKGFGVLPHAVAAANWYRRAAERGHA